MSLQGEPFPRICYPVFGNHGRNAYTHHNTSVSLPGIVYYFIFMIFFESHKKYKTKSEHSSLTQFYFKDLPDIKLE